MVMGVFQIISISAIVGPMLFGVPNAWSQQPAPMTRMSDLFEIKTRDPDQPFIVGPRSCRLYELGEFRELGLRIRDFNDVISGDDTGKTTDHSLEIESVWDFALVALKYKGALYTGEEKTPTGETETPFRELMDVSLSYLAKPNDDGLFYRTELGYQSFGDDQQGFGPRGVQAWTHSNLSFGSDRNYRYGTTREHSATLFGSLGYFSETESRGLYCRGECGILLNSEFDRSKIRAMGDIGITLLESAPRKPLFEYLFYADCSVSPSGQSELSFSPVTLRTNLELGRRTGLEFLLGVQKLVSQDEEQFVYTDYDWLGRLDINFVLRF